jgi:hypothetical protein
LAIEEDKSKGARESNHGIPYSNASKTSEEGSPPKASEHEGQSKLSKDLDERKSLQKEIMDLQLQPKRRLRGPAAPPPLVCAARVILMHKSR